MENKKNILVIGGTGIVGAPIVKCFLKEDCNVYSISLEKGSFPNAVHQYTVDRNSVEYEVLIKKITSEMVHHWDAVIDVFSFDENTAKSTYELFRHCSSQIVIISTTLVYDRSHKYPKPIDENAPLAEKGKFGGYVDGKVKLDQFWHNINDVNWTIVRPYHIIGAGSLLGCIAECNRDPKILWKIMNGETLRLCNGGNIELNCIHPNDIALAIYKIVGIKSTYKQAYNLVNPEIVVAKDYYLEIAKQIGAN